MTKHQKKVLLDAAIKPDLLEKVETYLKDINAVLTGSAHEKESHLDMLCNDIADYLSEKPEATIHDIIREFGSPDVQGNVALEKELDSFPEKIRRKMSLRRVVLVAAILVVTIVGIVYASALLDAHFNIKGMETETIDYIQSVPDVI